MATEVKAAKTIHKDLRDFLKAVEAKGELKRVTGANCDVDELDRGADLSRW